MAAVVVLFSAGCGAFSQERIDRAMEESLYGSAPKLSWGGPGSPDPKHP
jgi:hypothetical protein